jgi:hypothetical protein
MCFTASQFLLCSGRRHPLEALRQTCAWRKPFRLGCPRASLTKYLAVREEWIRRSCSPRGRDEARVYTLPGFLDSRYVLVLTASGRIVRVICTEKPWSSDAGRDLEFM